MVRSAFICVNLRPNCLSDKARGHTDLGASFGESSIRRQERAILHCGHCHMQGIQRPERDRERRQPLTSFGKSGRRLL
jgi:hypothetical protein